MNNSAITLIPYLSFQGNCEEALHTYREMLGGTVEIVTRYDNPAMKAPEEYKNKVLHARFLFDGNTVMASDILPGKQDTQISSNVALSITLTDPEKAKEIFDRLVEGGHAGVPFARQFWGDWHGNLTDRFGIRWMVNCEGKQ